MKTRLHLFLLAVAALLALQPPAAAAESGAVERVAAAASEDLADVDGPAARPAALPPGTKVSRDLAYGPEPEQRLDVYLPARTAGAPVLLMVHGGGWMLGDKAYANVVTNKLAHWLPQGFVVVSVNYRMLPKADPLMQADDIAKALAFAQAQAASWGADPARFVLMGHSSGAHLVALLGADPGIATRQGARPWLGTVALDSAALDLVDVMQNRHMRFYDRVFKDDPSYWREASPFQRLKAGGAPMLLVCSSRRTDSCPRARGFVDKLASLGGRASVYTVAMTHSELNQQLGAAGDYTAAVDAFIKSVGAP